MMTVEKTSICDICDRPSIWTDEEAGTAYCYIHEPIPPGEKTMTMSGTKPKDVFTRETMRHLYETHIINGGKSANWLAKHNGFVSTTPTTITNYLKKYDLPYPVKEQPDTPKPATASAIVPAARATDQLTTIRQLIDDLNDIGITVTGRAIIDLHIEIDMDGLTTSPPPRPTTHQPLSLV